MREEKQENTTSSRNNQLEYPPESFITAMDPPTDGFLTVKGYIGCKMKRQQRSFEEKKQRSFESREHLKLTVNMHSLSESLLRIIRLVLVVKIEKSHFHLEVISPHQMIFWIYGWCNIVYSVQKKKKKMSTDTTLW